MPADEADGPGGRAAIGFHRYADDTLRIVPEPRDGADAGTPARRGRHGSAPLIAAGLALIAGMAVAFAWMLTPGTRPAPKASLPAAEAPPAPYLPSEAPQPQAQALPGTAPAAPVSPTAARPSSPAAAIAPPSPTRPTAPPVQAAEPAPGADPVGERLAALARTLAAPAPEPTPAPPAASEPTPVPAQARAQPTFDCAAARSAAQQMVCGDPELADADRRMNRAYRAALAAGAPQDQLRLEQQDWLGIREDAARHSRRAVVQIYEQRIDDLRRWRDEAAADREPQP
jgi:uncharacterized protein YecT (DUF1311 family)